MEKEGQIAQHFALCAGPGFVSCLGFRDGDRVVPPARVAEWIEVDGLSHLSILSTQDASISAHTIRIDVRALKRSGALSLSIRATRPTEGGRVALLESNFDTKCSLPLSVGAVSLGDIEPGVYTLALELPGRPAQYVGFSIERISFASGIDAGIQCLCNRRFRSALAIFQSMFSIHPESRTVLDLINLTRAFLIQVKPLSAAGDNIDISRATQDLSNPEGLIPKAAITPQSEELSRALSSCANLSAVEWSHLMEALAPRFSFATTTTLDIFRDEIIKTIRPELQSMAARLDQIGTLSGQLQSGQKQLATAVARVETFVTRDYTPYIKSCLGKECAEWIGDTIISDMAKAEEQYRGAMNIWVANEPDFKVPLFSLLGALEALIRTTFDTTFDYVRKALANKEIAEGVRRAFGDREIDIERTKGPGLTLGQVGKLITRGNRIAREWLGRVPPAAAELLERLDRPDLTRPLTWISDLRNSMAHHRRRFTAREMLVARKLVLGIDELKIQREWACFPDKTPNEKMAGYAREDRSQQLYTWNGFPGIVHMLRNAIQNKGE